MMYFLPFYKKERIYSLIDSVLNTFANNEPMSAKEFAAVLGSINSGYKALGPLSRVLLPSSYKLLSSHVQPFDPTTSKFVVPNWTIKVQIMQTVIISIS